ncbi:MAG: DNA alkylation repair protein, partial [Clostridiales bacterium]|nr:DNA alkylation repair protein [Clostridiales bacterium]
PDADAPYEELMIRGLILAQADMPFDEHTRAMEAFLTRIDNWGVCDGVCSACRFLRDDREHGYRWLTHLLESDAEFTVRFVWSVCAIISRGRGTGRRACLKRRGRRSAVKTTMRAWRWRGCWPRRPRRTRAL